jgi:EAL domain-containing protein (putative c-di-GMP-specific phosphodiesterase class I)/FixJ family two-component response regulator
MPADHRILVLDHSPVQCRHVESLLSGVGFRQITSACTVQAALLALRQQEHQILILDLDKPDTDAIQFIDQLSGLGQPPLLLISSACSRRILKSVGLRAKEHGFSVIGQFPKPFTWQQARQLLQQCLARPEESPPAHGRAATQHPLALDAITLRQALQNGEIQAWFQPRLSLHTGRIVAAEAQARWPCATGECVLPGAFIPALLQHGFAHELFLQMLDGGLKAHAAWNQRGHSIPVGVSLPVSLLEQPELPDRLHAMATAAGVAPEAVVFELLEDDAINIPSRYYLGASRLRLKGFGLAQGYFGRGYNSICSLVSTPFTELKIGPTLVSGAWDDEMRAAALASTVALGHELGLSVTGEGVETREDWNFLQRMGCDCAQGFLISKAVDAERFAQMLSDQALFTMLFEHAAQGPGSAPGHVLATEGMASHAPHAAQ